VKISYKYELYFFIPLTRKEKYVKVSKAIEKCVRYSHKQRRIFGDREKRMSASEREIFPAAVCEGCRIYSTADEIYIKRGKHKFLHFRR